MKIILLFTLFLAIGLCFLILSMHMAGFFDLDAIIKRARCVPPPCHGEEITLDRWIKPPTNVTHNMTDEELFWRASLLPQVDKYPYERVPKVAFMFLTRGPLPLSPLWDSFFRGHQGKYSIYVHALPNYRPDFPSTSAFYGRQIPSQVAEWGKMSMCDAERRLLANALLDMANERFVLLSESCIPLYNFSVIYDYLIHSRHSFVGSFDDPGRDGRGRYNPNMVPQVHITQWRKGAQWFEVDRKLAVFLVQDTKYYPKFKEFCKPACYVDEHYFPTMLNIELPQRIANRSVTWVDWSRGGSHPATFGRDDITAAFLKRTVEAKNCVYNDQSTSICFLFARKFAPSALEPLLQFAPILLGFDHYKSNSQT
ncbi:hypothetical protein Cni_G00371 [Canna indica]|uniref:Core-2/I-branching beta-1,6-N-acetylglucosaminyltransferase family protein n=1 Tax=Canna indica TaxID=4628 RepID=A0AAQ3JL72_9LILI|nr:hypothetical protein Cni_G00371 [Canna indica]